MWKIYLYTCSQRYVGHDGTTVWKYAMYGVQTAGSYDILLNYIWIGKDNVKTESGRPNVDGSTV